MYSKRKMKAYLPASPLNHGSSLYYSLQLGGYLITIRLEGLIDPCKLKATDPGAKS